MHAPDSALASPDRLRGSSLRINFPMWLLDEPFPRFVPDDQNREHKLSLVDRRAPFLLLYQTLMKLGHCPGEYASGESDLSIFWTAKQIPDADRDRSIVMEVAWLPRSQYQISPTGSNHQGHYARTYQFTPLAPDEDAEIRRHLRTQRDLFTQTIDRASVERLRQQLPPAFALFPLQLANDFNLKFSGTEFARFYSQTDNHNVALAQACVDATIAAVPSLPIVFRQHPFDTTPDFKSHVRTSETVIDRSDRVSCHDIFATGQCKAVISINSNTVHEAAAWGVPSICLGKLIWDDTTTVPPFASSPSALDAVMRTPPQDDPKVLAYLRYLVRQQWTLSDFQNGLMVDALLRTQGRCEPAALRQRHGLSG